MSTILTHVAFAPTCLGLQQYFDMGSRVPVRVWEFAYPAMISAAFKERKLDQLKQLGSTWVPSDKAVSFVVNHDRLLHGGNAYRLGTVTFFDKELYPLALVFMLAHPYGALKGGARKGGKGPWTPSSRHGGGWVRGGAQHFCTLHAGCTPFIQAWKLASHAILQQSSLYCLGTAHVTLSLQTCQCDTNHVGRAGPGWSGLVRAGLV